MGSEDVRFSVGKKIKKGIAVVKVKVKIKVKLRT
jgi:hypothetical protein